MAGAMRLWQKIRRARKRFARNRSGSAAVEFAIIGIPFISMLFAVLEVPIVYVAQQDLQTAVTRAARLIMTGQAQTQQMSASQFATQVCNDAGTLFKCADIYVNVQKFSSFSSSQMTNPIKNGQFDNSGLTYDPGGPGDIIVVQVFYEWPLVNFFGLNLSNLKDGNDLLVASAAFRNEP